MHNPSTCTVTIGAVAGKCGEPAVWSNGRFAECAKHASDPGALAQFSDSTSAEHRVGDVVSVERHGKTYPARVVRVGARGAVYAEVTYNNGATRVVRV